MLPPLLLLHGVTNSASIWDDVAPLLRDDFDLIVPTAAGHHGGAPVVGAASISGLIDETERLLDARGLDTVHVAGSSMGGWMAIELARRGRARSVCALSPAGFWTAGTADETHATSTIRRGRTLARASRPLAPLVMRSGRARRLALRDAAEHAERLSPAQAVAIIDDLVHCTVAPDLLGTTEHIETLDPVPCPVTIAWSAHDRIFPPHVNGATARRVIPGATYLELPGVGHVPMIDDPELCASTIRRATQA